MFYIIGYTNSSKGRMLRVVDTEDKVVTDITKEELKKMMLEGTTIENASIEYGELVGRDFGLERYGSVGEDDIFVLLRENGDIYEICNQEGKHFNVNHSELIRITLEYGLANCRLKTIHLPKGVLHYIEKDNECQASLGKFKLYVLLEDKVNIEGEVITDNLSNYFIQFEYFNLDFNIPLKRCNGSYGNFLYYFGVIENYETIGDLWGGVGTRNFGVEPYIVVLVEYNIKMKRFTKGVFVVNACRESVYNMRIQHRGDVVIPCRYLTEEDVLRRYNTKIDLIKNKVKY